MKNELLSVIIFLPLLGAVLLFLLRGITNKLSYIIAMVTSIVTLCLNILLFSGFNHKISGLQFETNAIWIRALNLYYHIGIDGISFFFVLLTTILIPICILSSINSIKSRVKEYLIAFLLLECSVIGVFCALDLMLFFIFFEVMLIPMFLIIGIWGGENKIYATFKFFLYTMFGSVLLLVAIIYLYTEFGSFSVLKLTKLTSTLPFIVQQWLWVAFFIAFAIKIPMWPFHTWLPDAHVQAPTAGSVILAGILLKIGGYGLLRFSLPLFTEASKYFAYYVFILSYIAIIYASLVALMQQDMKKLIAYSSIAHMGFVTMGIFTFEQKGIEGAIVQMISHGLISSALFLCVGMLYDRMHTKEISKFGGVAIRMPVYATFLMFFTMASIGLPGTSGFIGEFLVMLSVYEVDKLSAVLAALGIILGAAYMLWLYKRVILGEIANQEVRSLVDINCKEILILTPLLILILIIGVYPKVITSMLGSSVIYLIKNLY
ncbi:NADH-quinone oxidoreductase subunit M [Rickettsiales bacterium Ac37b]|nr:NADH-quinone oxidoreductase subunit M [Rickettsiales bacterium Ac37b]